MIHVIVSNAEQRWNKGLICKHCGKCVAIEGENHLWVGIEEILGSQVCDVVLLVFFLKNHLMSNFLVIHFNRTRQDGEKLCLLMTDGYKQFSTMLFTI